MYPAQTISEKETYTSEHETTYIVKLNYQETVFWQKSPILQ